MFPALSEYKNQREALFDKTYKFLALTYMLIIPSIFGLFIVDVQFATVILGEKWRDAAPILSALSLLMLSYPLNAISHNLYDYLNKTHLSLFNDLLGMFALLLTFYLWQFNSIEEFANIRAYIASVLFLVLIVIVKITLGFSLRAMFSLIALPLVSSLFMYAAFTFIYVNENVTLLGFFINVFLGGLYFIISASIVIILVQKKSVIWQFWYGKVIDFIFVLKLRFYA